jgi:hypothetical protein
MSIDVFPATVLNSTLWNGQTYEEGEFTVTGTGFSGTAPSGTARYVRVGKQATLTFPDVTGTSNATTMTMTGLPASLAVAGVVRVLPAVSYNGAGQLGMLQLYGTTMELYSSPAFGPWLATGTKGLISTAISYVID